MTNQTRKARKTASNVARVTLAGAALLSLASCMSVDTALRETTYSCVSVTLDGPTTDSTAFARGVKVPDGVELTADLLGLICP